MTQESKSTWTSFPEKYRVLERPSNATSIATSPSVSLRSNDLTISPSSKSGKLADSFPLDNDFINSSSLLRDKKYNRHRDLASKDPYLSEGRSFLDSPNKKVDFLNMFPSPKNFGGADPEDIIAAIRRKYGLATSINELPEHAQSYSSHIPAVTRREKYDIDELIRSRNGTMAKYFDPNFEELTNAPDLDSYAFRNISASNGPKISASYIISPSASIAFPYLSSSLSESVKDKQDTHKHMNSEHDEDDDEDDDLSALISSVSESPVQQQSIEIDQNFRKPFRHCDSWDPWSGDPEHLNCKMKEKEDWFDEKRDEYGFKSVKAKSTKIVQFQIDEDGENNKPTENPTQSARIPTTDRFKIIEEIKKTKSTDSSKPIARKLSKRLEEQQSVSSNYQERLFKLMDMSRSAQSHSIESKTPSYLTRHKIPEPSKPFKTVSQPTPKPHNAIFNETYTKTLRDVNEDLVKLEENDDELQRRKDFPRFEKEIKSDSGVNQSKPSESTRMDEKSATENTVSTNTGEGSKRYDTNPNTSGSAFTKPTAVINGPHNQKTAQIFTDLKESSTKAASTFSTMNVPKPNNQSNPLIKINDSKSSENSKSPDSQTVNPPPQTSPINFQQETTSPAKTSSANSTSSNVNSLPIKTQQELTSPAKMTSTNGTSTKVDSLPVKNQQDTSSPTKSACKTHTSGTADTSTVKNQQEISSSGKAISENYTTKVHTKISDQSSAFTSNSPKPLNCNLETLRPTKNPKNISDIETSNLSNKKAPAISDNSNPKKVISTNTNIKESGAISSPNVAKNSLESIIPKDTTTNLKPDSIKVNPQGSATTSPQKSNISKNPIIVKNDGNTNSANEKKEFEQKEEKISKVTESFRSELLRSNMKDSNDKVIHRVGNIQQPMSQNHSKANTIALPNPKLQSVSNEVKNLSSPRNATILNNESIRNNSLSPPKKNFDGESEALTPTSNTKLLPTTKDPPVQLKSNTNTATDRTTDKPIQSVSKTNFSESSRYTYQSDEKVDQFSDEIDYSYSDDFEESLSSLESKSLSSNRIVPTDTTRVQSNDKQIKKNIESPRYDSIESFEESINSRSSSSITKDTEGTNSSQSIFEKSDELDWFENDPVVSALNGRLSAFLMYCDCDVDPERLFWEMFGVFEYFNIFRANYIRIYYHPNDVKSRSSSFSLKFELESSCAELKTSVVSDPYSPFFGCRVGDIDVHLTSASSYSSSPAEITLNSDDIVKEYTTGRKLWIVQKQIKSDIHLSEDFTVDINYLDGSCTKSFEITIARNNADFYTSLVREARSEAPNECTNNSSLYGNLDLTMTSKRATSPGCKQFTKGDLKMLFSKKIKLWIERKIPFKIDDTEVSLAFYPEQDFALIKWMIAKEIKRGLDTFTVVAINKDDSSETIVGMEDKLCQLQNHLFRIQYDQNVQQKEIWACDHDIHEFDFFMSHRQSADKDIVSTIHSELDGIEHPKINRRKVHTFWDIKCLLTAENWRKGFTSALSQSNIAILFISNECLEKIKRADVEADNVLLEWELALQKFPSCKIIIFPILVGRKRAFDGFDHLAFPEEKHCHEQSPRLLTIRRIVQEIFQIQGESVMEFTDAKLIKSKLLNTLSKLSDTIRSSSKSNLVDLVLRSSQESQLRNFLRPLDSEMKAERSRLLDAHVKNTRLWLLKELFDFLDPKRKEETERVLWLQGNAGVGKSVMSAFAADELEKRNLLAGMFFAKYDNTDRNSARNLIRTLCFQLCEWNAKFGRHILNTLTEENVKEGLNDRASIEAMFTFLILDPLQHIAESNPNPIVLVVDALDETGRLGYRREILQVFSIHCKKLPSFIKILVTSRPEEDIVATFKGLTMAELKVSDKGNFDDILIYSTNFLKMNNFPDEGIDDAAKTLSEKSGGLFVWLAMACRNLLLLEKITTSSIEQLTNERSDTAMDELYNSIFDRILGITPHSRMKDVLSFITVAFEPLKAEDYSLILDIALSDVEEILHKLRPVLYINEDGVIRFFHKSVADHLTDAKRCSDARFAVQIELFHAYLTEKCLKVLFIKLKYNIANLPPQNFRDEISNYKELVVENVPNHLRYAALCFWRHLSESNENYHNFVEIREFIENKLLNWIELLSLTDSASVIPTATRALRQKYKLFTVTDEIDYTTELLDDTLRLYQRFYVPISESALQIYFSAIPFCPTETRIYKQYIDKLPSKNAPKVLVGLEKDWPACLMTIEKAFIWAKSIGISYDGRYIIGAAGNEIKVWNVETGNEVHKLEGHRDVVLCVKYVFDSEKFIISGSYDNTIRIWNAESGECATILAHSGDGVRTIAISPNRRYFVSGGFSDDTVKIWSIEGLELVNTLCGHSETVNSIVISADSRMIISASADNTIKFWFFESGEEIRTIVAHYESINSLAIASDGTFFVSGSDDKTVKMWSTEEGRYLRTLIGHTDKVTSVDVSPDRQFVVSGSCDATIKIWSAASGENIKSLTGHSSAIRIVIYSIDGRFIASASDDQSIRIWSSKYNSVRGDNRLQSAHTETVICADISKDHSLIATGSEDRTIKIWSVSNARNLKTLVGHTDSITTLNISPDTKFIVSGSKDSTLKMWSIDTWDEVRTLKGHTDKISSALISLDAKLVISGSDDYTVRIWSAESGESLINLTDHQQSPYPSMVRFGIKLKILKGGSRFVSISESFIIVRETESGNTLFDIKGESFRGLSADGQYMKTSKFSTEEPYTRDSYFKLSTGEKVNIDPGSITMQEDDHYLTSRSWKGWISGPTDKFLFWTPSEFRVETSFFLERKYICVAKDFFGVVDIPDM
ncbi:hypothetical protein HK098_001217 [Nowakowskiella sp. JEL0407]|nr:hypothetical protein HK098_001217 [Nowakowskiella sp. JEL0407]